MIDPNLWNQLLVWPILNLLVVFYKLSEALRLPGALGFAIIFLTAAIRLLLYPLMNAQLKSAKKMAAMKPHMDAISAKHKDDKKAQQEAQMALYKEHGINPAAGCLPLLLQFPVLIALYSVFSTLFAGDVNQLMGQINQVVYVPALKLTAIDLSFFGINLGIKPDQWQTHGWWLLSIPVITGLLQFWQSKLMMPAASGHVPANQQETTSKGKKAKAIQKVTDEKKEQKPEDTAAEMQKQMMYIMPLMFGYFALQFPLGLALYWNVFGLFGIMQQLRVNKSK